MWIVAVALAMNILISYLNARSAGLVWAEAASAGGWRRFEAWTIAGMAACGFSWCILLSLVFGMRAGGRLDDHVVSLTLDLGYVILLPGFLFFGLAITCQSWAKAWRTRAASDAGISAYNTVAVIYNTYGAISSYGEAFRHVMRVGGAKKLSVKSKDDVIAVAGLLLVISLLLGILLTVVIIRRHAGTKILECMPAFEPQLQL